MVVGTLRLARTWLRSAAHRQAIEIWRQTRRRLHRQHDRIPPEGIGELQPALDCLRQHLLAGAGPEVLRSPGQVVREADARWLRRPRHPRLTDALEVFLVTLVAVVAIRTFVVMPTVIPTGSMQPTLYGITVWNRAEEPENPGPGWWRRSVERWLFGRQYYHVVARAPGKPLEILPPEPVLTWLRLPGLTRQRFRVGEEWYELRPAPEHLPNPFVLPDEQVFFFHAGLDPTREYQPGDTLINVVVRTGDHLLVDRFTYHWRRPQRGEIVVFQPRDLEDLEEDTFFIKRVVGLGGERVRIGNDRRVRINGEPIRDDLRGFRRLYRFEGPPVEGRYSGHLNERTAVQHRWEARGLSPLFPNERTERLMPAGHLFLLGDNSVSSLDSRRWGPLPEWQVVGRAWCVYWPLSSRTGFGFE